VSEKSNSQNAGLTREDVAKVADLAMLNVSEEELDIYTPQLGSILKLAEQMESFDLDGLEPTAHPHGLVNIYRKDEIEQVDVLKEILSSAPQVEDDQFKVPPALGEEL